MDEYLLQSYDYTLPKELIAKEPLPQRDDSRLLIVDRKAGNLTEIPFRSIVDYLQSDDQLILNDTKVIRARLFGKKESGGAVEIFLLRKVNETCWETLAKPARKLAIGTLIHFSDRLSARVISKEPIILEFIGQGNIQKLLEREGKMPLPHYMDREATDIDDTRYQTVFAENLGAVAAPTAGLHFTESLLAEIKGKGVSCHTLTLHVGLGTFKPIQTEDIRDHQMHTESYTLSEETAAALKNPGQKFVVGTTALRTLEATKGQAGSGSTNLFIYPGYTFHTDCALLTNFHLPKSSLYILVSAFAGRELIREAYQKAIKDRFRFYSYGDAMLIM